MLSIHQNRRMISLSGIKKWDLMQSEPITEKRRERLLNKILCFHVITQTKRREAWSSKNNMSIRVQDMIVTGTQVQYPNRHKQSKGTIALTQAFVMRHHEHLRLDGHWNNLTNKLLSSLIVDITSHVHILLCNCWCHDLVPGILGVCSVWNRAVAQDKWWQAIPVRLDALYQIWHCCTLLLQQTNRQTQHILSHPWWRRRV